MKRIIILLLFLVWSIFSMAQLPPHPGGSGGSGPGLGDPPVGAPLEGGTLLMLALAFGYGNKKVYNYWKSNKK